MTTHTTDIKDTFLAHIGSLLKAKNSGHEKSVHVRLLPDKLVSIHYTDRFTHGNQSSRDSRFVFSVDQIRESGIKLKALYGFSAGNTQSQLF